MKARAEALLQITLKEAAELGLESVYIQNGSVFDEDSKDEVESKVAKFLIGIAEEEKKTNISREVYTSKITVLEGSKKVEPKVEEKPKEVVDEERLDSEPEEKTPKRSKKTG